MSQLTGAQFLADSLHALGVTHVFFVPAILSHTLAELDRRTPIQRILTHGEKSAVYMADGYARASRRVGVSFAQCIGAANLAAGLRDPYLACSPLVVLTGGPSVESRGRHVYQEIEDYPLFKPLTKYSARVDTLARLPEDKLDWAPDPKNPPAIFTGAKKPESIPFGFEPCGSNEMLRPE